MIKPQMQTTFATSSRLSPAREREADRLALCKVALVRQTPAHRPALEDVEDALLLRFAQGVVSDRVAARRFAAAARAAFAHLGEPVPGFEEAMRRGGFADLPRWRANLDRLAREMAP